VLCFAVAVPSPRSEFMSQSFGDDLRSHQDGSGLGGITGTNIPLGGAAGGAMWSCQHCTYHNAPHQQACDMCGLPRQ